MAEPSVPLIDLTAYRRGDTAGTRALAEAVDRANREIGFLIVSGHGGWSPSSLSAGNGCRGLNSCAAWRTLRLIPD